jgi:hypothetical protein
MAPPPRHDRALRRYWMRVSPRWAMRVIVSTSPSPGHRPRRT